ncbi:MAG TPA: TadE/TadG family type IV pilus assembly protein [Magnetospirillum sp.]|nr:TadE/TadG family type IV pilus assembly protein [Magnetospirillum sp.]
MRPVVSHRFIASLWHDRRGVVGLYFAVIISVMLLLCMAALDMVRVHMARSRIFVAMDSAMLAAGRSLGTDNWAQVGVNYFNANMNAGTTLGAKVTMTADSFKTTPSNLGGDEVALTVTGTIPLWSAGVGNISEINVSRTTKALRRSQTVELAMVLDNTGSMTTGDNIGALRTDALLLLKTLSGGRTTGTLSYSRVALVPYSAAVNPGAESKKIISDGTVYDPTNVLGWRGCVIERAAPNTTADTTAAAAAWTPYVWAPAIDNKYVKGDAGSVRAEWYYGNSSTGPNVGCPTPITPLTDDITRLTTDINAMQAWFRGGTLSDIGMAWGLRVLSPEPPFTEGTAWTNTNVKKAVVLMTDGDANFFKLGNEDTPNKVNDAVLSDFTGYGRLDEFGRIGTTDKNTAKAKINSNLSSTCTAMKARNIHVYTITFGTGSVNDTTRAFYKACASDAASYFSAADQTQLKKAFSSIGGALTELIIIE